MERRPVSPPETSLSTFCVRLVETGNERVDAECVYLTLQPSLGETRLRGGSIHVGESLRDSHLHPRKRNIEEQATS